MITKKNSQLNFFNNLNKINFYIIFNLLNTFSLIVDLYYLNI